MTACKTVNRIYTQTRKDTEFPSVKAVPWGRHAVDLSPWRAGYHHGLADTAVMTQVFITLLLFPRGRGVVLTPPPPSSVPRS